MEKSAFAFGLTFGYRLAALAATTSTLIVPLPPDQRVAKREREWYTRAADQARLARNAFARSADTTARRGIA